MALLGFKPSGAVSVRMPAGMTHEEQMNYHHDIIVERMAVLRTVIDELETLTAAEYWPYPTYSDLLFSV